MCACIYIHAHIHINTHIYIHTFIHTYKYTYICICLHFSLKPLEAKVN